MARKTVIVDWKSGFVAPEARLQIAAYANGAPMGGGSLPVLEGGLVVQVNEKHCKAVVVMDSKKLARAYRAFAGAKETFDWMVGEGFVEIPQKENYRLGELYLPSVTFILQYAIAKPGLMNWYRRMGAEGRDPEKIKNFAGDRGSQIHKTIHLLLSGVAFDYSKAPSWLAATITHAAAWVKSVDFVPIHLEQPVVNPLLGYAGTLDTVGTISEKAWDELTGQAPAAITHKGHVPADNARDQELARFLDAS